MTERGKKIKETFLKKYGVEHPSQLPWVKEKIKKKREEGCYDNMVTNIKKTLKERYGDENYNNLEKCKKTKLEKYGDENYNNREKMLKTNNERYGMNVSPNTLKSTIERSNSGEFGFKSPYFKNYLKNLGVTNISQTENIRKTRKLNKINETITKIFEGDRLKNVVLPLFDKNEYTGCDYDKLYKFKCCICGNEFEDNLYSGNIPRCLVCYPHNRFKSKIENEIIEFLNSHNIKYEQHNREILNGEEIDIYLPDFKIGIECDGIYWHSEIAGNKNKKYHINKTELCNGKHINLIHIWDWEWMCKKEIVKSILINKIGKSKKIHGRKCIIKEINNDDKKLFLESNHIQGDDKSSIRIGLFYENELVSVMTFSKPKFNKTYEYELSRYCNKINTCIQGGSSKMFNYFTKKYNPKSVITYSDRRFFSGNVYINVGFIFDGFTSPGYHYFNKNNCVPIDRLNFQKHKLRSILKIYDYRLSEWENMQLNGYDRIWDCGHVKYVWFLND